MDHATLRARTAEFARRVARFTKPLFRSPETYDVARQLRRGANGIASNYRAAGLSRSHAEFTARMGTVLEETDEVVHWLVHLQATEEAFDPALLAEAQELLKIFTSSYATACRNERAGGIPRDMRGRRRRRA